MPDPIDILITVQQQGNQIAQQVRSNINALRVAVQQLNALQAGNLRANAQQVGSLQQLVAAQRQTIQSINQLAAAQRGAQRATDGTTLSVGNLIKSLGIAAAAFAGFQGFKAFTEAGLEFNATIENANLGIATLIVAQAKLHDANGNLLTGTAALGAAQDLAAEQVTKLRVAGLQTVATTQELIKAFQQAVGVGLRWGFTLDQARKFTVQMSQAAAALQLPMDQLNEEIRSLLAGTINPRNTRIASALHITNEQIRQAQQAGTLFEFVTKRMEAFSIAGEATARTFSGVMSNIKEALQQLTGEATKPLFDKLKETGLATLEEVFDMKNARISEKFSGIIEVAQRTFGVIGDLLADAIGAAVKGAESLSAWLKENNFLVTDFWETVGLVVGQFKGLLRDIFSVVGGLTQAGAEAGAFNVGMRVVALIVALIRDGLKAIVGILGFIGGMVLELILDPFRLLLKAIAAVVQFTNKDMADSLRNTADQLDGFLTGVSHGIKDIWKDFANGNTATQQVLKQFDEMGKAADKTTKAVKDTSKALATVTANPDDSKKRDPAKLAAGITAAAKAELSRQQRDLKIALDNNKISYQEYYDGLTKAQQHSIDEQIRAQNILLNAAKTDDARDKIKSDIKQLSEERIQVAEDNAEKLRAALEKLDDEIRKAQIQLLKDQGKNAEARALEVEGEFKKMQARLQKNAKEGGANIIASLFDIDNAKAQMMDLERQVKIIADELKTTQEDIQVRLQAHTVTQREAQNELADAYERARSKLSAILPTMAKVAEITQDPNSIQAVKDLGLQLNQWDLAIKRARDDLTQLKDGLIDSSTNALATFFQSIGSLVGQNTTHIDALKEHLASARKELDQLTTGPQDADSRSRITQLRTEISGVTDELGKAQDELVTWTDLWKDAARSIVQSLQQIASQMIATIIIQNALKFFGFSGGGLVGGGSSPARVLSGDVGGGVTAATGGYITGPGTGTSDSIPAWLSHGEYVINAKAVKSVGIELLHEINGLGRAPGVRTRNRTRGYAEGGLVTATTNDVRTDNRLTVGLEDGLIVRELETQQGTKALIRFAEKNSNKLRQAMGIG
jgi:hypothetical protein